MEMTAPKINTKDIAYIGIFAALMAICSWISLPLPSGIPVTLQTFAVFLAVGALGGRRGTITVLVYLLLAATGAPVAARSRYTSTVMVPRRPPRAPTARNTAKVCSVTGMPEGRGRDIQEQIAMRAAKIPMYAMSFVLILGAVISIVGLLLCY